MRRLLAGDMDRARTGSVPAERSFYRDRPAPGRDGDETDETADSSAHSPAGSRSPLGRRFFTNFFAAHGGGTFIEVGAEDGPESAAVAENANVACLAFEPNPLAFVRLRSAVAGKAHNGNVALFNMALFDAPGQVAIACPDSGGFADPVGERQTPRAPTMVQVRVDRLDTVIGNHRLRAPVVAKITAPGAESRILAGGRLTFSQAAMLAMALHPAAMRNSGGDIGFIADYVAAQFTAGAILRGGRQAVPIWRPIDTVAGKIRALPSAANAADNGCFYVLAYKGTNSGDIRTDH